MRAGTICSETGSLSVIDSLHRSAIVSPASLAAGDGGLVLGFATPDGSARSLCDFNLGQVRHQQGSCVGGVLGVAAPHIMGQSFESFNAKKVHAISCSEPT